MAEIDLHPEGLQAARRAIPGGHGQAWLFAEDAVRAFLAKAEAPRPIDSAPKDGTTLRLLVEYDHGELGHHPLEDSAAPSWTIGFNTLEDTGEDEWHIVGWSWQQDCFCDSGGKPIGWLPFLPAALSTVPAKSADHIGDATEMIASPPAAAPAETVVKPLEWGKYRNGDAEAVTPFGEIYTAYASGHWRVTKNGKAGKFIRGGDDLGEAKSAADADHAHRVRSCLLPAAAGVPEPVRWRHKKRGTTYVEIGRGLVQADRWWTRTSLSAQPFASADMAEVVVYQADEDGSRTDASSESQPAPQMEGGDDARHVR